MTEDLAPVILFIYKRPEHTRKTLEALHKNQYADGSILYVFADGPKDDASAEDLKLIDETRAVIKEKNWCKDVFLVNRKRNMNLEDNVIDGITEVIQKHGKAIILEDDIITSPYFLKYCNDGLTMYKDDKQVFAINGFMYPVNFETEAATFLCPLGTNPWGWATWADRWGKFEYSPENVNVIGSGILLKNRFNFGNINFFQILSHLNTWDLRWYYTSFVRNGLGLFPTESLVQNIGFDNSGTHTGFGVDGQELYSLPIPLTYQSSINLNYYSKFLAHHTLKPDSVFQKMKNRIKKMTNYKNYNSWGAEPGQKLY